jgi:hypothetical protein
LSTNAITHTTAGSARLSPATAVVASSAAHPGIDIPSSSIADEVSLFQISDAVAEEQLNTFCYAFLPFFPFVHIPALMRASELRLQKPFLWLVIMSLTTKSVAQQIALGNTIRRIVAQKVIVEHERSMDIVLGLIGYLAWLVFSFIYSAPLSLYRLRVIFVATMLISI